MRSSSIAVAPEVNTLAAAADPAEEGSSGAGLRRAGRALVDASARGAIYGLTRKSGGAELCPRCA